MGGDPARLRQIVVNLVGNAVKFTEAGEVALRVELEGPAGTGATLHFTVSDTGVGISAEKQATIFESFTQADASTTRRFGGTGLGLAIASQLVGLMGGRIWVESQPGQGSHFHFTIPFRVSMTPPAPVPRQGRDLEGMPVLVVDDNATNRHILDEVFTTWGMRPTVVDGGAAGLQAMEAAHRSGRPFPLVVLDYQMPEMDGFEVAERIGQRPHLAGDDHDAVLGGAAGGRPALPGAGRGRLPEQAGPAVRVAGRAARGAGPARDEPGGTHAGDAPFPARGPGAGARTAAAGQRA